MIRILLVDDQNLIIQIIQVLLENDPNFKIIGIAQDGRTAVEKAEKLQPDIILIDLEMPKMNGITATEYLNCLVPQAKVIVLTSHEREQYLIKALKAGAKGYLLKNSSAEDLKKAIVTVNQGYSQIESKLLAKIVEQRKVRQRSKTKSIKPTSASIKPANKKTENTKTIINQPATSSKSNKSYRQTNLSYTKDNHFSRLLKKKPYIHQKSSSKINRQTLSPIFETSTVITKPVSHQKRSRRKFVPFLSIVQLFKVNGLSKIILIVFGVIISLYVLYAS